MGAGGFGMIVDYLWASNQKDATTASMMLPLIAVLVIASGGGILFGK